MCPLAKRMWELPESHREPESPEQLMTVEVIRKSRPGDPEI